MTMAKQTATDEKLLKEVTDLRRRLGWAAKRGKLDFCIRFPPGASGLYNFLAGNKKTHRRALLTC